MLAKELRIGSLVLYEGNVSEVLSIDSEREFKNLKCAVRVTGNQRGITHATWLNHLEPIPLSEEWMDKFGFTLNTEVSVDGNTYYETTENIGLFWFILTKTSSGRIKCSLGIKLETCTYSPNLQGVDSVHGLQNLYFAVTSKDLVLNED